MYLSTTRLWDYGPSIIELDCGIVGAVFAPWVGGKLVLAMFLNLELFWMNNKAIIEFGFRIIWRIMEISQGVIRLGW